MSVDAVQRAYDTIPFLSAYDFQRFIWATGKDNGYVWKFSSSCHVEAMRTAYIDTICMIRDDEDGLSYTICI